MNNIRHSEEESVLLEVYISDKNAEWATTQYPGAHIKPKGVLEQIEAGVHFQPTQYILKLLKCANQNSGNTVGITKFEI